MFYVAASFYSPSFLPFISLPASIILWRFSVPLGYFSPSLSTRSSIFAVETYRTIDERVFLVSLSRRSTAFNQLDDTARTIDQND